jgi:hypothetical protein
MKKMTNPITVLLVFFMLAGLALTACKTNDPEIDIDAQKTGFALTAEYQANMTSEAAQQTQPTETSTPQTEPSPTPTATQESAETDLTPTATATVDAAATSTPLNAVDAAQWLANDPPDNTSFEPGENFTVTWTIENTGSTTWTTSYYIMFYSGEQMNAEEKVFLPYPVPPGKNVQISVDFEAPDAEGTKQSNWMLKNAKDETFYSFYVIIEVGKENNPQPQPTDTTEPESTPTVAPTP